MKTSKDNVTNQDVQDQISIIKDSLKNIIKNAKYGSYDNFLKDLSRIESSTLKIQLLVSGIPAGTCRYGKILVPYDGSSFSKKAIKEAIELAKAFGSKLFIITVIEIASDIPAGVLNEVINKKLNKLRYELSQPARYMTPTKLQQQIDECKKQGIDVKVEVSIGNAADSIIKFVNQNQIELVVMGSRGLRGIKKLTALGSVSRRIAEEAKCPVLIVK